jgi:hypothetical protein
MPAKILPNETFVFINSPYSWEHKNWGIVKGFDGDEYHVAMNNGVEQLVFSRRELRVPKTRTAQEN